MRLALVFWLLAQLAWAADDEVCFVCGKKIEGQFYRMTDKRTEAKVAVCADCESLESRCFACGLPVPPDARQLADGRYLCARDARDAVLSDEDARQFCEDLMGELNRQFSRFMNFPTTNVTVSVVDQFNLQNLFKSPGYEQACVSVFGATSSHRLPDNRFVHSINLLSALSKPRLRSVFAHELTHAWMGENVGLARRQAMAPEAIEAFCELIAYRVDEARHDEIEQRVILSNPYTRGQIDVFVAVEDRYGFNDLLDWVKSGEDPKLEMNDLDRVRAVKSQAARPSPTVAVPGATPAAAPDRLLLKGISGPPKRRLALINDTTFAVNEVARVRVGTSNVLVSCLEIRSNSVVIRVGGSASPRELILGAH